MSSLSQTPAAPPDFVPVFEELDAGLFSRKVAAAIAETALAVVNAESAKQTGEVALEFKIARIGEGAQISMTHRLKFSRPTRRGKRSENDVTLTLLYVGKGGKLTVTPDTQIDLFKKEERKVVE